MILDALGRPFHDRLARWLGKPWPPEWWRCCCAPKQTCDSCAEIPNTLYATLTSNCPSINGRVITLTWDPSLLNWSGQTGTGICSGFSATFLKLSLTCAVSGPCSSNSGCMKLFLQPLAANIGGCIWMSSGAHSVCPDAGCSCGPVNLVYTNVISFVIPGTIPNQDCCGCPSDRVTPATITITITE